MKRIKRLLCICLAATMILCALPATSSAGANGIIFMAVNDSIPMTLSADTMPFYSGGTLYIPYTLFNVSALGVTPSYSVLNSTLTLFTISDRIVFDLSAGTSTDTSDSGASWSTITKSGNIFVPADYCASLFGIGVSKLTSLGGYSVVRFTTGDQVYDDSYFIEKADSLIETRVVQYFNAASVSESPQVTVTAPASSASASPSSSPAASATPSPSASAAPTTTDEPEPSAEEAEEPEEAEESEEPEEPEETENAEPEQETSAPQEICLLYQNAAGMEELATALEERGETGAFFLTATELEAYPTLLSRLKAGGHAVGLLPEGETAQERQESLERANALADSRTKQPLLWVFDPNGDTTLAELGYLLLTPDSGGDVILWQTDSTEGIDTLDYCAANNYTILTLRETSTFLETE